MGCIRFTDDFFFVLENSGVLLWDSLCFIRILLCWGLHWGPLFMDTTIYTYMYICTHLKI